MKTRKNLLLTTSAIAISMLFSGNAIAQEGDGTQAGEGITEETNVEVRDIQVELPSTIQVEFSNDRAGWEYVFNDIEIKITMVCNIIFIKFKFYLLT